MNIELDHISFLNTPEHKKLPCEIFGENSNTSGSTHTGSDSKHLSMIECDPMGTLSHKYKSMFEVMLNENLTPAPSQGRRVFTEANPIDVHSLIIFHRYYYPADLIYQLYVNISKHPATQPTAMGRSLTFTTPGDIPYRYNFHNCSSSFKNEFVTKDIKRVDIGPWYQITGNDRLLASFTSNISNVVTTIKFPLYREFVLDIDLDDIDHIRVCAKGKTYCKLCFQFIIAAKSMIESILSDIFGFSSFLWVASGSRGVHLTVFDTNAISLSNVSRNKIIENLKLVLKGNGSIANSLSIAGKRHAVR
jgi:hypothetical protein